MPYRERERERTGSRLITFSLLLLVGINGFFAATLWVDWQDSLDQARRRSESLAESLAAQATAIVSGTDRQLSAIAEVLTERMGHHHEGGLERGDPEVAALLLRRVALTPHIRAITIVGANGTVLNDSRGLDAPHFNLADRDYFTFHRDGGADRLFIDQPAISRTDKQWFIGMSRRLSGLDGRFVGVINAVVDPKYFRRFFEALGVGGEGFVMLFGRDGMVYAREPDFDAFIGQRLAASSSFAGRLAEAPSGSYETTDAKGEGLIVGYRSVANYPLVVMTGLRRAQVLASWRHQLLYQLLAALLANLAVVGFTWGLRRQVARLEGAARELGASESKAIAAQRQLADAIESMTEGFALFDADGRLVLFNDRYRKMCGPLGALVLPGLSYEELLRGVAEAGFVIGAGQEPEAWIASRLEQHRNPTGTPVEQETSEGEWVLARTFPTREGGRVHIRTDITYLKEKQLEAAQQELVLRTTVENIVQGLCVFDAEGRLALWNRNWINLLRLPAEFARAGTRLADIVLWRAARGDYGPGEPEAILARRMNALSALDDHVDERVLPDARAVEVLGVPMPGGGRLTTYTDITVRRNAERALRQKSEVLEATLESVDQGIAMFDREFRLIAANRRYYQLLEFPPEEFGLGTPFVAFLDYTARRGDYGLGDVEELVVGRLQAAQRLQPYSFERVAPGGTVVEARRKPTADGGFVTTYTDITERKRNEDELRAAKITAERASEVKSLFLAKMSHELRTPFNAIIGFADMIATRSLGDARDAIESYAGFATEIRDSGQNLLDLLNNILDISKIESGRMEMQIDRFDLHHTLKAALGVMRVLAHGQGVALVLEAKRGELPETRADERAIKQIVTNLLSNALKFTPEGGRITLEALPAEDGGFVIKVRDTGLGIAPDQIARVMLPFEQGDNRYSRTMGGTGLGLALVKGLVELHGGSLGIESELGHGTVVTAIFPATLPEGVAGL